MEKWTDQIMPQSMLDIFETYLVLKQLRKEEPDVKLPLVTLHMSNGTELEGDILSCDFSSNTLVFMKTGQTNTKNISFIDIKKINFVSLKDLDRCPEFLNELSQDNKFRIKSLFQRRQYGSYYTKSDNIS